MKTIFLLTSGWIWGQSVNQPQMGVMVDSGANARAVFGVSASVTLGDPILGGVISSACSDWCIYKTASAVVVAGQPVAAPAGAAIFAIDGSTAAMYFIAVKQLALWQNGQLTLADVPVDGDVVGLRSSAGMIEFAIRRRESTWVVNAQGAIVDFIPGASGPVMLLANGILYVDGDDVVLRRPDATEVRFAAPGAQWFSALGANYVQIRANGFSYGLRVDAGHERIFELPEPAP